MEYSEAERYILSFTDYEQTPGVAYTATTYDLRRMEDLLHRLGDPHRAARTAHVAGTKGKGSTAAMIASALTATGYRTGLYTSPHFLTMRERIRVDGRMISEADFARAVDTLLPEVAAVNAVHQENALTTFEVLTAVAFTYFSSSAAAYQVLEVGLGGRLDATNVVLPDVAVITSISLDHTQVLGNTVAQIAGEKAG
ncbi:MAG: bifunctional folylpolyglutamate synthase/dihydrofolate synthase, partial [Chloroflexi bacterium]|nr:bifunctional folylpolyglutamate synthase/dihydrofolate synthase [Chloroflexota bacterium]